MNFSKNLPTILVVVFLVFVGGVILAEIPARIPTPVPIETPSITPMAVTPASGKPQYVGPEDSSIIQNYLANDMQPASSRDFWDFASKQIDNQLTIPVGNYRMVFGNDRTKTEDQYDIKYNAHDLRIYKGNTLIYSDLRKQRDTKKAGSDLYSFYYFTGVISSEYQGASYYFIEEYTGGAHCCFLYLPMVLNKGRLQIGKSLPVGDGSIYEGSFFVQDNHLNLTFSDSRFGYYLSSFAGSGPMFYPDFYRFNSDASLIQVNDKFIALYKDYAALWDAEVEKLKSIDYDTQSASDDWAPVLGARLVYQLLAGESKVEAFKSFEEDFQILSTKYGLSNFITDPADTIEKEIAKELGK